MYHEPRTVNHEPSMLMPPAMVYRRRLLAIGGWLQGPGNHVP
jgi:hypothetical protein